MAKKLCGFFLFGCNREEIITQSDDRNESRLTM